MLMQILIVDDSPVMRNIVKKTLLQSGYADANFTEVENGLHAIEALNEVEPAMILSDWNMPDMNGLELLKSIRESGKNTPFGFITTEFTEQMRVVARDNGAHFLLTKPFNSVQLKAMLDPILRDSK